MSYYPHFVRLHVIKSAVMAVLGRFPRLLSEYYGRRLRYGAQSLFIMRLGSRDWVTPQPEIPGSPAMPISREGHHTSTCKPQPQQSGSYGRLGKLALSLSESCSGKEPMTVYSMGPSTVTDLRPIHLFSTPGTFLGQPGLTFAVPKGI